MSAPNILNVAPNATLGDYSATSGNTAISSQYLIPNTANNASTPSIATLNTSLFPKTGVYYLVILQYVLASFVFDPVSPAATGFLNVSVNASTTTATLLLNAASTHPSNAVGFSQGITEKIIFTCQKPAVGTNYNLILYNGSGSAITSGGLTIQALTIIEMNSPTTVITSAT